MTIELPDPIAAYVAADNAGDDSALAACFAADAEVRDEGRTIRGVDAILAWKADAKRKYQYTIEPLAVTEAEGGAVLTGRVSGRFPGSPVELRHVFGLKDGRIATLEIHG